MTSEATHHKAPFVIEWRDGFKIGIDQVDQEHRQLFSLVRALDLATVDHTVDELLNYVVIHFSNEQALMEKSGYPAFEQHLKLHEEFAAQVGEFLGGGHTWTEERVQELRKFLNKWLIGHIMTHDLRFGKWLTSHHPHSSPVAHPPAHAAHPPAHSPASKPSGFFARLFGLK